MQDTCGPARQALQGFGTVQIAQHRCQALCSQKGGSLWGRCQSQNPGSTHQLLGRTLSHIAAANDQDTFFAKASGQGAQRGLV